MKWKNLAIDTNTYFITATIRDWRPLFNYEPARQTMLADFNFYRSKYSCRIIAYVLMPEHYHMVVDFNSPEDLHGWMREVQGHSSTMLSRWLMDSQIQPKESKGEIWKEQARGLGILTEHTLRIKIDYIHSNPVKRGLCATPAEWPYSSWRNYYRNDESIFRIDRYEAVSS